MRSNPEVYRLHDRALFHFNFLSVFNFWFIVVFVTYNFCPSFRVCILAFCKANGRKHHSVAMILATLFSIQHCCARKHRALLRRHTTHHHKSSFSSARSEKAYAERIEIRQIEAGSRWIFSSQAHSFIIARESPATSRISKVPEAFKCEATYQHST